MRGIKSIRIFSFILAVMFFFGFVSSLSDTDSDGYLEIHNCNELQSMNQNLFVSYELANDIDCSDTRNWNYNSTLGYYQGFEPVGNSSNINSNEAVGNPFAGNFNGNNYEINGLYNNCRNFSCIGGLFFVCNNSFIENVKLISVNITGRGYTGGLVGKSFNSNFSNIFVSGNIYGSGMMRGGVIGWGGQGFIRNSAFDGEIIGGSVAGGLIGASLLDVLNCSSKGIVNSSFAVGGLIGSTGFSSKVINSFSESSVYGSDYGVGGLIGTTQNGGEVLSSYSIGNVYGGSQIGGLIGKFEEGQILNSFSFGNVTGFNSVGGLVGSSNSNFTIRNSYSLGLVNSGGINFLGLVGSNNSFVFNSYYNSETSGQSDTGKGIPKTSSQMKIQSTYSGWDFENIWAINSSMNSGYPYLLMNTENPVVPSEDNFTMVYGDGICSEKEIELSEGENYTYYVVDSSGERYKVVVGSRFIDINNMSYNLSEGELKTISFGGEFYNASIDFIASNSIKFNFNGEITVGLGEGNTYNLGNGIYLRVNRILYASLDNRISRVEFYLTKKIIDYSMYVYDSNGDLTDYEKKFAGAFFQENLVIDEVGSYPIDCLGYSFGSHLSQNYVNTFSGYQIERAGWHLVSSSFELPEWGDYDENILCKDDVVVDWYFNPFGKDYLGEESYLENIKSEEYAGYSLNKHVSLLNNFFGGQEGIWKFSNFSSVHNILRGNNNIFDYLSLVNYYFDNGHFGNDAKWLYVKDSAVGKYFIFKTQFPYNQVRPYMNIYGLPLFSGWNFLSVSPSMIFDGDGNVEENTINDFIGDCSIRGIFMWDNPSNSWVNMANYTFVPEDIGKGFIINVNGDCRLGNFDNIEVPSPPELPTTA
jgi:hypothetical protein